MISKNNFPWLHNIFSFISLFPAAHNSEAMAKRMNERDFHVLLLFCSCYHHQTLWHQHFIGREIIDFSPWFLPGSVEFPAVVFLFQFHDTSQTRCFFLLFIFSLIFTSFHTASATLPSKEIEEHRIGWQNEEDFHFFRKSHLASNFINLSSSLRCSFSMALFCFSIGCDLWVFN